MDYKNIDFENLYFAQKIHFLNEFLKENNIFLIF